MGDVAIRVDRLGKQYRLGKRHSNSLRESLVQALRAPWRRRQGGAAQNGAGTFWALKEATFEVKRGEVIGIIGRNGAGKSTLLKILSRVTEPSAGTAELQGRVASLLEVGSGFHLELTGRENIFLNGAILGMSKSEIQRKFSEIVDFSEVEEFIDTPVKHYSSGMYMRLAFAVAAHLDPEILIIDEVLAVGDLEFQKKCLQKMGQAATSGRTVLFVSHNMAAVQSLCHRAVHLQAGQVVNQGPTREVVDQYMAESQSRLSVSDGDRLALGPDLHLERLHFTPNPVEWDKEVRFEVGLAADAPARVRELALIIFSQYGPRAAVIDLRQESGSYELRAGQVLRFTGRIRSLPLVEGDYHVGMFINGGEGGQYAIHEHLIDLRVPARPPKTAIPPYNPRNRGILELDTDVFARID